MVSWQSVCNPTWSTNWITIHSCSSSCCSSYHLASGGVFCLQLNGFSTLFSTILVMGAFISLPLTTARTKMQVDVFLLQQKSQWVVGDLQSYWRSCYGSYGMVLVTIPWSKVPNSLVFFNTLICIDDVICFCGYNNRGVNWESYCNCVWNAYKPSPNVYWHFVEFTSSPQQHVSISTPRYEWNTTLPLHTQGHGWEADDVHVMNFLYHFSNSCVPLSGSGVSHISFFNHFLLRRVIINTCTLQFLSFNLNHIILASSNISSCWASGDGSAERAA